MPTWPEAVWAEPAPVDPVLLPTWVDAVWAEPAPVEPVLLPSASPESWVLVLSSPFPDLPPAVSPRESELFSPVSLWFELAGAIAGLEAALTPPLPLLLPELLLLALLLADALADACELLEALLLDCELAPVVELAAGAVAPLLDWLAPLWLVWLAPALPELPLPPLPPVPPPPPPVPPPPPMWFSLFAVGLS